MHRGIDNQVGSELYRFTLPAHSWATLRTMPATGTIDLTRNNKTAAERSMKILQHNGLSGCATVGKSVDWNCLPQQARF